MQKSSRLLLENKAQNPMIIGFDVTTIKKNKKKGGEKNVKK